MATKKVTPAATKTTGKKAAPKKAAPKKTTAKKTPAAKKAKAKPAITNEDIQKKAEEIYHARMASGEPGNQESDWLNAEKALKGSKK